MAVEAEVNESYHSEMGSESDEKDESDDEVFYEEIEL